MENGKFEENIFLFAIQMQLSQYGVRHRQIKWSNKSLMDKSFFASRKFVAFNLRFENVELEISYLKS